MVISQGYMKSIYKHDKRSHTCIALTLQTETASVDADIQKEYARQREHLERSVASLRKKLTKDTEIHRADNVRIMQVRGCDNMCASSSVHVKHNVIVLTR